MPRGGHNRVSLEIKRTYYELIRQGGPAPRQSAGSACR
ncbi:UNVERIFIED_CONTAM: hypothetical protein DES50_12219 [Williamsia faeni]